MSIPIPFVSRVEGNRRGRDFVAGDVHGCFRTLDHALAKIRFEPGRDRLFAVGDLVNRGPNSREAREWIESRRISTVMGNHEAMLLGSLEKGQPTLGESWQYEILASREEWIRTLMWLPIGIEVETEWGRVAIVHAGVTDEPWEQIRKGIDHGDQEPIETAVTGGSAKTDCTPVPGLHALVTGHRPRRSPGLDHGRWRIDTGAGIRQLARLTLVEIGHEPRATTVEVVDEER